MLSMNKVEKRYNSLIYINMVFTVMCFSVGAERLYLIPLLVGAISVGYFIKSCPIKKELEAILGCALLLLFLFIHGSTEDILLSVGGMLIGIYVTFFLREPEIRNTPTNVVTIFGVMLVATFLTDRLFYIFLFIPFTFLITPLLFHQYLQQQKVFQDNFHLRHLTHDSRKSNGHSSRKTGKFVLYGAMMILVALIFISIPRFNWEFSGPKSIRLGKVGFSKNMESTTVARMLSDPNVFFYVKTPSRDEYFQGVVYDHYSTSIWENKLPMKTIYTGRFQKNLILNDYVPRNLRTEIYEIYHYEGVCVFYRDVPYSLWFRNPRMNRSIKIDQAGNINTVFPMYKRLNYHITSGKKVSEKPNRREIRWAYENYLQLPKISDRVVNLARKITRNDQTEYQKTIAIWNHLKSNYSYTLNVSSGENEMADYFLFEAKKGYCLHFASSMAVMLRILGVPTRLIGGFRASTYDNNKKGFVVTNEDAHAWVEVFLPNMGWTRFDPTPPQEDYLAGLDFWKRFYYHMQTFWARYVIGFSNLHQEEILAQIKSWYYYLKKNFLYWLPAVILLFSLRIWFKFSNRQKPKEAKVTSFRSSLLPWRRWNIFSFRKNRFIPPSLLVGHLYGKMNVLLQKLNIKRGLEETPFEFANRANRINPKLGPFVDPVTKIFCAVRFGKQELAPQEQKDIEEHLVELEKTIKEFKERKIQVKKKIRTEI